MEVFKISLQHDLTTYMAKYLPEIVISNFLYSMFPTRLMNVDVTLNSLETDHRNIIFHETEQEQEKKKHRSEDG